MSQSCWYFSCCFGTTHTWYALSGVMPPSTSIQGLAPMASHISRSFLILPTCRQETMAHHSKHIVLGSTVPGARVSRCKPTAFAHLQQMLHATVRRGIAATGMLAMSAGGHARWLTW